jgi:two-component system, OmpR family, KDP operon response regulator KdpE
MIEIQPTVLIIEDEEAIRKFLRVSLAGEGYRLVESATAQDGLLQAASCQPDIIILDLGLPDLDGVELTRQIRQWSKIPIIIVSARGKEQDKVVALDAGADDYLTKPFSVGELLARLRVALRHATRADSGEPVFETGDLRVDLVHRKITRAGETIHLTPNEYRLLTLLVKHAGKVLTHTMLLKEIWGPGSSQDIHYLRVYMNQLRQKLETDPAQPKYLLTEPGVGYRLNA